jgi:uncharacterized protein
MDAPTTRAALLELIASDSGLARLHALAASHLDDDPGHNLAHALRVALAAARIAVALGASAREAIAAALLHDLVNVPKNHPDRHHASERSAAAAAPELECAGFAPDAVRRIAGAIRDHSFSRGAAPETPLGDALQDADRLEALGVIGLFRCLSTGVRMGAHYFHDDDPFARARPLDDRAYSIDHLFTKLLGLPATMRTAAGRAEAEQRATFLRLTLAQLGAELGEAAPTLLE